jgi:hypothetical protein
MTILGLIAQRYSGVPPGRRPDVVSDPGDKSPYVYCVMSLSPLVDVVVLRPRPYFRWYERKSRRLLYPYPSSILANRLDPRPRTKDDEDESGFGRALNRYQSPGYCHMSLPDAFWPAP